MQESRAVTSGRTLSWFVIAGLVGNMLADAAAIIHELAGTSLVADAVAGKVGQPELVAFDDLTRTIALASLAVYLLTGILWLSWQYLLVKSVEPLTGDEPLKRPFRSVLWWFAPWLNLITVPQIYGNLRDRFTPGAGAIVGRWWGTFLLANFVGYVVRFVTGNPRTAEAFANNMRLSAVADALSIIAAIFAIVVVRTLQRGQDERINRPPLSINTLAQGAEPAAAPSEAAS